MPGRGGATVLDDLPESIVLEEILVRLPPKDLVRCRAVRKCWHSATSTDKFILDNHRRQPLLPILCRAVEEQNGCLYVSYDAQQQLCHVLRSYYKGLLHAALDGLLIVSHELNFFICNPVTRKCAPLGEPQGPQGFDNRIVGLYQHQPSGEYRVLWCSRPSYFTASYGINYQTFYHAIAVGSDNPRCVRQASVPPPVVSLPSLELVLWHGLPYSCSCPPVHHCGNLHWKLENNLGVDEGDIMVFNTADETFRLMCLPAQLRPRNLWLVEMDGTLALCSISSDNDTIDVWVIQDYHAETWSLKHRINLLGLDPSPTVDLYVTIFPRMAVLNEGKLLIQFTPSPRRVLRYDMDGKFLGYVKSEEGQEIELWITKHYHKESVISLPIFHETRDEDEPPFFVGL